MEKQSGMDPKATFHHYGAQIRTEQQQQQQQQHSGFGSGSGRKSYMILKAKTKHPRQAGKPKFVKIVIRKHASYEQTLKTAFDAFKVPKSNRPDVALKCRPKGSPVGTPWMHIQPAVWKEIVEDMEFYLSGFHTDLRP